MKRDFAIRALPAMAVAGLALVLAGCSQTTYGTGTSAGLQTVTDFAKAASIVPERADIDFAPRPPVVAPPSTASLPPPGSGTTLAGVGPNWPTDPDQESGKVKAQIAAAQATGKPIVVKPSKQSAPTGLADFNDPKNYETTPEQSAEARRLLAASSSGVDASGNPVRQYLTDPPVGYLQADPTAPAATTVSEKKGATRLKWPWQWFSKD